MTSVTIPLYGPLGRAAGEMLGSAPGLDFDFLTPAGEEALVPADSVSWRVFKNPVTLFIGGVAAVLLELAEPSVRDGVWQHSSFRRDPMTRLRRTGLAAMVTIYGARSKAETMIAGVVRAHGRVTGTTSEGVDYHANDPVLLDWVQATATYGFVESYSRYARRLTGEERDRAYAEGAVAARLYGAVGTPAWREDMRRLFADMDMRLVPSPIIAEFLGIMARVPALPRSMAPVQRALLRAAVGMVPEVLIRRLGLEAWRPGRADVALARTLARASDRIVLRTAPPAQAALRLGLPANWAYRR